MSFRSLQSFLSNYGAAALAASFMLSSPSTAQACGGFFCSQSQPVNQAAERILFADNGDGTITAVIQILYEGPSEKFSWLLPISSVPEGDEIAVASDLAFQRLQLATNPQYNLTTRVEGSCRAEENVQFSVNGAPPSLQAGVADASAMGSGVTIAASGVVGSFEWTVLELDESLTSPADAAPQWLAANDYDIPPASGELIGPYLDEGRYLLALRLTKGSNSGSIRPLVLTYDAELPDIPIKLTAVAANEDMGVMAWVAAEKRAIPFNFNSLQLNEARINWFNASANYNDVVTAAANDAGGGHGFVTEFAQPSTLLENVVWSRFEEDRWRQLAEQVPGSNPSVYVDTNRMFETSYFQYAGFDGFWDAVRDTVSLPEDVSFEDFQGCPSCYETDFDPAAYIDALNTNVVEPMRRFQKLLDSQPYLTRFYSTLSAAEMTVDPVFAYNSELGDVDNIHRATRVIECTPGVFQSEANWHIELPQGGVIRGGRNSLGTWPAAVAKQAPNFRILQLSTSGTGDVLEDNEAKIKLELTSYNDSLPVPEPRLDPNDSGSNDLHAPREAGSGGCSLAAAPGSESGTPKFWLALVVAVGATLRRRKSRTKGRVGISRFGGHSQERHTVRGVTHGKDKETNIQS